MSIEAHVMALLEEGNPATEAPGASWSGSDASTYLASLEQGSKRVVQLETKPRQSKPTGPAMGWVLAAAAVIVVGAIILATNDRSDPPPADQPTTTTTAAPTTTTTTTTVPIPRDLATAQAMMAGLYEPGGAVLAALPWANLTVSEEMMWVSDFGAFANAEVLDFSCEAGQNTVTCTSISRDDLTRAVDESAVYSDSFTLAFDGPSGQIVNTSWLFTTTGRLNEFFTWTENNVPDLFDSGDVCNVDANRPAECAVALLELVLDFEEAVSP